MSRTYISVELRHLVIERANGVCEYCHIHQDDVFFPHEIDHIIAQQHGGETLSENLALACLDCNKQKGPNIASIDPLTGELTGLFNPRKDVWVDHFQMNGVRIEPLSPIGRATVLILQLNHSHRLRMRQVVADSR